MHVGLQGEVAESVRRQELGGTWVRAITMVSGKEQSGLLLENLVDPGA